MNISSLDVLLMKLNGFNFFLILDKKKSMNTVYHKVNVELITNLLTYKDGRRMQVCVNKTRKVCELYRSYPDVKKGVRLMRGRCFDLDKSVVPNLAHALNKLKQRNLDDKILVVVSESSNKRLVIKSHDQYKSLILGYQKRKVKGCRPNEIRR